MELSAVEAVELDPPELPEAFVIVPVWDERDEEDEGFVPVVKGEGEAEAKDD